MLKKIFISIFLFLSSISYLKALDIPLQFFVKQHWFSLTNTFDVESKDKKYGTIHRKLFSWMPQYLFYDVNNQIQAVAKMRFFSLGATFDIYDAEERSIGKVDEKILTFFSTFKLYRADGYYAARAKLNFWGTKYTVRDSETDEVIAFLWRRFFRLKDNWTVDIVNPSILIEKQIDPRMFILVMAFQTDRDYWEALRYQGNNSGTFPQILLSKNSGEVLALEKNLENYRLILETYREQMDDITPHEADLLNIEKIVENHLASKECEIDQEINQNEPIEVVQAKALEKGVSVILPLMSSDDLTLNQKSALFFLLDQTLN